MATGYVGTIYASGTVYNSITYTPQSNAKLAVVYGGGGVSGSLIVNGMSISLYPITSGPVQGEFYFYCGAGVPISMGVYGGGGIISAVLTALEENS
jgi:hypothetical protein